MGAIEMPARALKSGLLLIVASGLLSGCTAGANYARPIMPTPPDYRFVQPPSQAQTLADAPWFQVFDDPALQGLIRDAIANNLDLRIAVARVEEARARAGISRSYLYPQVDGVAGYGVRQASTTDENDDTTHQNGACGFRLSWEIDLFGRIRRGPKRPSHSRWRPSRAGAASWSR
jgi:outer membrane protein TolC